MRIMTILGTRPEIIRLDVIMKKLDQLLDKDHITVWTGQNYDKNLKDIFLQEFGTRKFNSFNNKLSSQFHFQMSDMFTHIGQEIIDYKPDKILILGDTNSSLAAAIVGERMGVPVYHMEAGNRCYDPKVPEEKNRMVIDRISSFNMPYVQNSKENLLREGFPKERIFVTGNPIHEVMKTYQDHTLFMNNDICKRLEVEEYDYVLATAHRAENVDDRKRFVNLMNAINKIANKQPVIFSVHPRTRSKLDDKYTNFAIEKNENIKYCEPFSFFDFICLQRYARCIITDSGTVQEEACILKKPCVVIRDSTERPETVEAGSAIISGLETENICRSYDLIMRNHDFLVPEGYLDQNVSVKVLNFLMGNQL